jgi:hypothetical protein
VLHHIKEFEAMIANQVPTTGSDEQVINQLGIALLPEFIKRWRSLFIEILNPQHLSSHWTIDRKESPRKPCATHI